MIAVLDTVRIIPGLRSGTSFVLTLRNPTDVGPKRAAEIATPLAVALVSVVICIGGIWYHRWYFGRRGVEVARFDFVPTPQVGFFSAITWPLAFCLCMCATLLSPCFCC